MTSKYIGRSQAVVANQAYNKDESDARYLPIDAETLPDQDSHAGKYLTTDGSDASWGEIDLSSKVSKSGDTMTGGLQTQSATNVARYNGNLDETFGNALAAESDSTRSTLFVGTNSAASVWWTEASGGNQIAVGAVDGVRASSGGGLTMWSNNATVWTMGLRVNGGSQAPGSIDLPAQPIISGQIGDALINPVSPQKIAFNDFFVSRGITYNSSTRRFTVPVDGVYRITMNPFFITGASAGRVLIGINNDSPGSASHYGHTYRESATYDTGCLNSIVTLSASDYIVFYLKQGSMYNQTTDRFSQFTIQKIA